MHKPLVVVESPTKVRTIKKYLGDDYNVVATIGHLKDLPAREIGIDIEDGFTPKYQIISGKQKVVTSLKRAAGDTDRVYLAPDPDREGEAIAWHTADILKKKGRRFHRVLFHELTRRAIQEAMTAPTELDAAKYEAQQARRILDRLVGYQISPMLWRKVKGGLSAGRVQSVAVRIICERERAIQAFEPQEYWSITAHLAGAAPPPFAAKLVKRDGRKLHIPDEDHATRITTELAGAAFTVAAVKPKTIHRHPQPPFTTSKLQQESIRKLRFSAQKTMRVAQQLYEGVDLGPGEPVGLITYMRTDSTRIADEAAHEARDWIRGQFGDDYALSRPRVFKNRKKVQDAHEAIRPTSVLHRPDDLAAVLTKDQRALYELIWKRFLASQMAPAKINQNLVSIEAGPYTFTSSGSTIAFPGFMALYLSADDEHEQRSAGGKAPLPPLTAGQRLELRQLEPAQHFTQPPPRFSEASLVKELEENGIGRPSTYAAILSTIRDKGYVELLKGYFHPTELGCIVTDLLVENFPDIFGVHFTARMEDELDRIETSEVDSRHILSRFHERFTSELTRAAEHMLSMRGVGAPTDLACPACGQGRLHIKVGKNGEYLACNRYPECRYTSNYERDVKGRIQPIDNGRTEVTDQHCERCQRPMLKRQGRYGAFLACSGYPECTHTQSLNANGRATGVACPRPDCDGELVEKQSRRGKVFYGCNRYPTCDFALWDRPVTRTCPECGAPYLVTKRTKRDGAFLACTVKGCGYREDLPAEAAGDHAATGGQGAKTA